MNKTQRTIELTAPHTHGGRDYPAGAILTMDADSADWLIALKCAKDAPKSAKQNTSPQPE